jgi:hypothetical protein
LNFHAQIFYGNAANKMQSYLKSGYATGVLQTLFLVREVHDVKKNGFLCRRRSGHIHKIANFALS